MRVWIGLALIGSALWLLTTMPETHAQTSVNPPFVLLDDTPPVNPATTIPESIACYGYDGTNAGANPQGTLVNDGVILRYMTRQMHLVEQAQQWHGFVWMDPYRNNTPRWVLVTYPAALCSYYPDPAKEAIEGHYWIDPVH